MKKSKKLKQNRLNPQISTTVSPYTLMLMEKKQKEMTKELKKHARPNSVRRMSNSHKVPLGAVIDRVFLFEEHVNKHFPELVKKLPPM